MLTPAQLTDVNNETYGTGVLGVWNGSSDQSDPPDFVAPDYNVPTEISGTLTYFVGNQFFMLTNLIAEDNITPVFYKHRLPAVANNIQVIDLDGNVVPGPMHLSYTNVLFHNFDGGPYRVQYVNANGSLVQDVLRYDLIMQRANVAATTGNYNLIHNFLTLPDTDTYYIKFLTPNGYQVMPMYTYLPNTPWYARVRFGLLPPAAEWASQPFIPYAPWLLGTYIAGTVLDKHMIEFERKGIYNDPSHLPDILVFNKDGNIKFALDGFVQTSSVSSSNPPFLKGFVYNWQRGQISSMDHTYARVDIAGELDPTDIVWGFYAYNEPDVLYTDFDLNPVTNPAAKNTILQLYAKFTDGTPGKYIYHQLLDAEGNAIPGQTNDPNPTLGTNHIFAQVMVGSSVSEVDFTYTDVRVHGGGLWPQYQNIPPAVNFWDIGYWDGKPYPIAGAVAIYLPYSILNVLGRGDIEGRVKAALPMGAIPIIRYIDEDGLEWV